MAVNLDAPQLANLDGAAVFASDDEAIIWVAEQGRAGAPIMRGLALSTGPPGEA
jgi:hypothetical protein